MIKTISIDLSQLAKAVANIDGGCSTCIISFLNKFPRETSSRIVKVIESNNYSGYNFKYDEEENEWIDV